MKIDNYGVYSEILADPLVIYSLSEKRTKIYVSMFWIRKHSKFIQAIFDSDPSAVNIGLDYDYEIIKCCLFIIDNIDSPEHRTIEICKYLKTSDKLVQFIELFNKLFDANVRYLFDIIICQLLMISESYLENILDEIFLNCVVKYNIFSISVFLTGHSNVINKLTNVPIQILNYFKNNKRIYLYIYYKWLQANFVHDDILIKEILDESFYDDILVSDVEKLIMNVIIIRNDNVVYIMKWLGVLYGVYEKKNKSIVKI